MNMNEIIEYCLALPAAYVDYPFDDVTAALRHGFNKKIFALIMDRNGETWLNLKAEPIKADFWRSVYKSVVPGYHMNKTHWNSVVMGGDVPADIICAMINDSYDLIKPKKTHRGKEK